MLKIRNWDISIVLRAMPLSIAASFLAMLFCVVAVGFFGMGVPWLDVYFPGSGRYYDQALKYLPFSRVFLPSMMLFSALVGLMLVTSSGTKCYLLVVLYGGVLGLIISCVAMVALVRATSGTGIPGVSFLEGAIIGGGMSGGWLFGMMYFPLQLWLLRSWVELAVSIGKRREKLD